MRRSVPVTANILGAPGWRTLANFGSTIFSAGLLLSLPVVAALQSGSPAGAELSAVLRQEDQLSEEDLARAAGLVEEAGGKQWTENEAAAQLAAAHQCLAETPMPDDVRAEFAGIAEFITARQS